MFERKGEWSLDFESWPLFEGVANKGATINLEENKLTARQKLGTIDEAMCRKVFVFFKTKRNIRFQDKIRELFNILFCENSSLLTRKH